MTSAQLGGTIVTVLLAAVAAVSITTIITIVRTQKRTTQVPWFFTALSVATLAVFLWALWAMSSPTCGWEGPVFTLLPTSDTMTDLSIAHEARTACQSDARQTIVLWGSTIAVALIAWAWALRRTLKRGGITHRRSSSPNA